MQFSINTGQVWIHKENKTKIVIIAVNIDKTKVCVAGWQDEVSIETTVKYLGEEYEINGDYNNF